MSEDPNALQEDDFGVDPVRLAYFPLIPASEPVVSENPNVLLHDDLAPSSAGRFKSNPVVSENSDALPRAQFCAPDVRQDHRQSLTATTSIEFSDTTRGNELLSGVAAEPEIALSL